MASQRSQIRATWPKLVIGITPGMIGTVDPDLARGGDEVEVGAVVEEELGDQERAPASTLVFR